MAVAVVVKVADAMATIIHQDQGRLSKTKRGSFQPLTDVEIEKIESAIKASESRAKDGA
jgi:hypothetical protein